MPDNGRLQELYKLDSIRVLRMNGLNICKLAAAVLLLGNVCSAPGADSAGAEQNTAAGDAALFAGKTDVGKRYLRLGELALENDDHRSAADFLTQALKSLQDPEQRRLATDLLHESLLAAQRNTEADALLASAVAAPEFGGYSRLLKLMQARRMLYTGNGSDAIKIFRELSTHLDAADRVCFQALELLAMALNQVGDYEGAQKSCADLAAISSADGLWKLKALEGLIFNALAAGDTQVARTAWQKLQNELPEDLRQTFSDRLQKISWLVDCHSGAADKVEPEFRKKVQSSSATDPLLARVSLALSDLHRTRKDYIGALELSRKAFDLAEKVFQPAALRAVIENAISGRQLAEALQELQKYLEYFPGAADRSTMLLLAGNLNVHLNNFPAAAEYYQMVFNDPSMPRQHRLTAALELAGLSQKLSKMRDALKFFEFAIEHSDDSQRKNRLRLQYGEYLYQLGRYADAVEQFQLSAEAGIPGAALWLAQAYYQLKNYTMAAEALKLHKDFKQDALTRKADYLQALLSEKLLDVEKAVTCYVEFVNRYPEAPEAPEALFQAGVLAMTGKKYDPAELFEKYAAAYPGEKAANALYKALDVLLQKNDAVRAGNLMQTLENKYPDSKFTIGAKFRMSDFLRQQNRHDAALELLNKLETSHGSKHPELKPEIYYERALLYSDLKDSLHMLQELEKITRQYADHAIAPRAFFLLGNHNMHKGDYAAALGAFQQAQERSGGGVFAYGCAGRAADAAYALYTHTRQEQYLQQAMERYENLLNASDLPGEFYFQSLYKLGRCSQDGGNEAGALRRYRELLYRALLARRESRFYPSQWCVKALDGAIKLLQPALKEAPDAVQAQALYDEAERLLKTASELSLPGVDTAAMAAELKKLLTERK